MRVGPTGQMLGPCDQLTQAHFELFPVNRVPKRLRDDSACVTGPLQAPTDPPPAQPTGGNGRPREDVEL